MDDQKRDQKTLLLVNATTKINGRLNHCRRQNQLEETIVLASQKDCDFLTHQSAFDCNRPCTKSVKELLSKIELGDLKIIEKAVSDDFLEKLRRGVAASRLVPPFMLNLL
jgi:hypothetical protein